jgi:type I restriction enzyme, S subunit
MDTKALRQKILDLAIRGKLVPQDPNDEPAEVLLERIREQKQQMLKEGKLKKKDIKNDTIIFKGEDNLHYEKFADGSVKCIEDEIPFELPEGWAWARLGPIFLTVTGSTPSTKDSSLYGTDYPFYKPTDLDAGYKVFKSESTVSEKGYRSGRPLPPHSILVTCIGATIGKTGYIHNAGICNQQINAILPNTDILSDYTYFCICSQFEQQQILMNSSATTLPILNKGKFDNLLFPVPPHEQQLLIVDKIQDLLTLVNKIQDNQGFLKDKIIATKAKILDLAISGKLVPQDPDDEPASVLLERIRAEKEVLIKQGKIKRDKKESIIFKGEDNSYYVRQDTHTEAIDEQFIFELPDNWEWCSLLNIAKMELGKTLDSAKNTGINYPYLRSVNVRWNDVDLSDLKEMRFEPEELERYTVRLNDLLICEGGDVGRSCVWTDDKEILYQNALHRVRFYGECNPFYFMYYMMYYESLGIIKALCKGVTIKHLTGNVLSLIPFALPPIKEQSRIVEKLNQVFTLIDRIISD